MVTPIRSRNWPALLGQLITGSDLDASDTTWAMNQVMSGAATQAQIAAFVVALRAKGDMRQVLLGARAWAGSA